MERKGAAYTIKAKKAGENPNANTQPPSYAIGKRERYQQAMDSRAGRAREKAEPIGREPHQQAMDERVKHRARKIATDYPMMPGAGRFA